MILLISVWDCEDIGIKDDGEGGGGRIRVKRTETVLSCRLRSLGHILAS